MNNIAKKDKGKLLFYIAGVALPTLQFVIFYMLVNFNSVIMAFQNYDMDRGYYFSLSNFVQIWNDIFKGNEIFNLGYSFLNSLKTYGITLLVGTTLNILFSNYIYKKNRGHKFFQILLFLPQILSAVVLSVVYMYFMNEGIVLISDKIFDKQITALLFKEQGKFNYILAFTLWAGFGAGVLMYTSTMTGISKEIVESAELDGITPFKELIHITLPIIYPTFVTFMVIGVAGIFTNQVNLYTFYGLSGAPDYNWTIGYFIYKEAQLASGYGNYQQFTYLSAFGLVVSFIAIVLTFVVKRLLEKFGPSVD